VVKGRLQHVEECPIRAVDHLAGRTGLHLREQLCRLSKLAHQLPEESYIFASLPLQAFLKVVQLLKRPKIRIVRIHVEDLEFCLALKVGSPVLKQKFAFTTLGGMMDKLTDTLSTSPSKYETFRISRSMPPR